jgi:probable HAF family extracellular repeat protein
MKTVVLGACLILLICSNAFSTVRYNVTEVPGMNFPRGMNDHQQVVGFNKNFDTNELEAYSWQNGVSTKLPSLSNIKYSGAQSVNNSGTIVGFSTTASSGQHATMWLNGQAIDLFPTHTISDAEWINERGDIVGSLDWYNGFLIFPYQQPVIINNFNCFSINNSGTIAGLTFAPDGEHAAIWTAANGIQDIDPPVSLWADEGLVKCPGNQSWATMISDDGLILGFKFLQDSNGIIRWRLWTYYNGLYHKSIQGSDHANIDSKDHSALGGSLWDLKTGNQILDFNTLIPSDSGWNILGARYINENGYIAGEGSYNGKQAGFLLTPITNTVDMPSLGWYLIAQPVLGDHQLTEIQVRRINTGETLSYCDAWLAGWVQAEFYWYDHNDPGYKTVSCDLWSDDTALRQGKGYWVCTNIDHLELIFP